MNNVTLDQLALDAKTRLETLIHGFDQEAFQQFLVFDPEIRTKVLKGLRWGLFSKKSKRVATAATCINESGFLTINGFEMWELSKELSKIDIGTPVLNILSDDVLLAIKDKKLIWTNDYNEDDEKGEVVQTTASYSPFKLETLLQNWDIVLMPADVDDVFCEDITDMWYYEYMDQYVQWLTDLGLYVFNGSYAQIGGYAGWIQGRSPGTFVAQVNNDWGDAGSVYLSWDVKNSQVCLDAQCY